MVPTPRARLSAKLADANSGVWDKNEAKPCERNIGLAKAKTNLLASKLFHQGVDSWFEMAEGDWHGSLTAGSTSVAERRSQQRTITGLPATRRWAMEGWATEARRPAGTRKAKSLTHRTLTEESFLSSPASEQDDKENLVTPFTTHRLLNKPSSARGSLGPGQHPLLLDRAPTGKKHSDSNVAAAVAAQQRFAATLAIEEPAVIQSRLVEPEATIFLPRAADQMPPAADGCDPNSSSRRSSKRASSKRTRFAGCDEVQDALGELHGSIVSLRRAGRAAADGAIMQLNMAGQCVVQSPEVLGSRSASKKVPSSVRIA